MEALCHSKTNTYTRRRPELTPCYRIIQEELSSFIAERQAEGRPLPEYVIEEFEAYLKCGVLAHGFIRLKCESCQQEKIVAFSCKKRGFCPSCCVKRMAEAATHLEENVLPKVAYRQFVVTFPIPLRFWLQTNSKLYASIHRLMIRQIHRYYTDKAKACGIKDPKPGSISFTQRAGSACNLNVHAHVLCMDGVYTEGDGQVRFRNIEAITDQEVANLLEKTAHSVMRFLRKKGYLDQDGEVVQNPEADPLFRDHESLSLASQASISGRIAFGPNAGKMVTRIGSGFGYLEEIPLAKGHRCYSIHGFSLHCNTSVNALRRDKLHKLIEYMARGPLSNERLEITDDKKVKLRLKTAYSDGTTHLLFTLSEFLEKLVAIIPPPKSHLVRWGGVLAPNSPLRKKITLKPEKKKGFQFQDEDEAPTFKNSSWSKMLAKVFKIDVTTCECCGGKMQKICAVLDGEGIRRYLRHLNMDPDPPPRTPARVQATEFDFDQSSEEQEDLPVIQEG